MSTYAKMIAASGGNPGVQSVNGDTTAAQVIAAGDGIAVSSTGGTTTISATGGSGIQSINGDTTAAQTIAAGSGISISSTSGTTTISASGGGGDISNGGNTTGADITIGTQDDFQLTFLTNNIPRLTLYQDLPVLYVPPSDVNPIDLQVSAGSMVTSGNGGNLTLVSGGAVGTGNGGDITLYSGAGASGLPGNIIFTLGAVGEIGRVQSNGTFALDNTVLDRNADPVLGMAGQCSFYMPLTNTTNATPKNAFSFPMPSDTISQWEVRVKARSGGNCAAFSISALVSNIAGTSTVTTMGTPTSASVGTGSVWTCVLSASSNLVNVVVTGAAATNITWDGYLVTAS